MVLRCLLSTGVGLPNDLVLLFTVLFILATFVDFMKRLLYSKFLVLIKYLCLFKSLPSSQSPTNKRAS